jgi:hypothetical protein
MDNWVFEYNVCVNGFGSATNHGEWCNNNFGLMTNQVIRYNRFVGPTSGYTGVIVANNNDIQDPVIYGNVFDGYDSGNGVITGTSGGTIIRALIYNNTFLNCGVGWLGSNAHTSSVAKNNLLYNMSAGGTSGVTVDYSHYVSCTSVPSETNKTTATGNPFTNSAAGNYTLLAATTAGLTLSSPFTTDPTGATRASDGTWDRGAFEFGGADVTPPTVSSVTVASNGTTVTFTMSESCTVAGAVPTLTMSGGAVTLTYASGKRNEFAGLYRIADDPLLRDRDGGIYAAW